MNVFLCGNGYSVNSFIETITYILNFGYNDIVLLHENYLSMKKYCNIPVIVFKTLNECIEASDCIIVLRNEELPENIFRNIEKCVADSKKKLFAIDMNNNKTQFTKLSEFNDVAIPSVLILAMGLTWQSYCTEIKLHKALTSRGIKATQRFSNVTENVLVQLDSMKILNKSLSDQINNKKICGDIFVESIYIGEDINSIEEFIPYFRQLKPDFIALQTDFRFEQYDIARQIAKYWCFSQLDIVVKSKYTIVNDKYIVYCDSINDENMLYTNSCNLGDDIIEAVISKLTLPKDCKRIE